MRNKAAFFKRMRLTSLVCVMALTGILFSGCPVDSTTYTVSFSAGEGTGTAPAKQEVTAGKSVTLPGQGTMTAPTGKPTFAGWKTGGGSTYEAGASATINADTVFTAQWTAGGGGNGGNTYSVSFSAGEGSGSAPASQTVTAGASITLPQQGTMTAPSGKTFAGWKSGSGSTYQAGASVTINADTVFTAQWTAGGGGNEGNTYSGFYNYPTGRVDSNNGTLNISNTVASQTLLFMDTVDKDNYIGTVGSLSSVKVKLPAEKFYTIVAVDKATYEEQGLKASQSNVLTHYSNTMAYSVSVTPLVTYGGGTWIFNNNTAYWVQIRKTDMSGNYAVIAPGAQRVSIPVALSTPYDYYVYFYKELKLNGKVIAVVESSDRSQANTAQVTNAATPYTTNIQATDIPSNIKPAVMVKNNSNKSVRVYYSNQQKTNGSISADFVIVGGASELLTGFEPDDDTASINFAAVAWTTNKAVPVSMTMQNDKVYEIIIPQNENASEITVTEVEASKYYN